MAAITTLLTTLGRPGMRVRTFTANAATTTDAVAVPEWASFALVTFITTVVTTSSLLNVQGVSWGATSGVYDTTTAFNVGEHLAFTALTAANILSLQMGPGVTGIADDVVNSATAASQLSVNCVLPPVLYITVTNTGATTGTLDIMFRRSA